MHAPLFRILAIHHYEHNAACTCQLFCPLMWDVFAPKKGARLCTQPRRRPLDRTDVWSICSRSITHERQFPAFARPNSSFYVHFTGWCRCWLIVQRYHVRTKSMKGLLLYFTSVVLHFVVLHLFPRLCARRESSSEKLWGRCFHLKAKLASTTDNCTTVQ